MHRHSDVSHMQNIRQLQQYWFMNKTAVPSRIIGCLLLWRANLFTIKNIRMQTQCTLVHFRSPLTRYELLSGCGLRICRHDVECLHTYLCDLKSGIIHASGTTA